MALNNSQYDVVMRIYDRRRFQNNHARELRIEEVYAKVPRIKEIEAAISSTAVRRAKELLLRGGETPISRQLSDDTTSLIAEKNALLEANGFARDYMELSFQCPHCKDTGYIDNQKCSCFKQAVIDMLYTQSNLKQILTNENFSTFNLAYYDNVTVNPVTGLTSYQNMQKILASCLKYVEDFDGSNCHNLLFYGESGTGKTFMTNCIAKELIEKSHSVIYLTAISLFELFEKQAFGNDPEDALSTRDLEQYLFDCDLLIIDDLGTESINSFTNSKLFYCLNERLLRSKSTIISTNLTLDAINSLYSERIASRIISNYTLFKLYGDDIRMKKKLSNC